MHCLHDYIGIKGFGSQEPLSGMFINQLPGITLESMDRIAEKEQVNFVGVWKDIQARSWMRLEKDFRIALRNRYRLSALRGTVDLAPITGVTQLPPVELYRGIVIDINQLRRGSKASFLCIYIDRITVNLPAPADSLVVKIFDRQGTAIDTITKANATQGVNTILLCKRFPVQSLFIAIDTTEVALLEAELPTEDHQSCCRQIHHYCPHCEPHIYPATAAKGTPSDWIKEDAYASLSVRFSAICDYSAIICSNRSEFTDVWMYLLATELMIERLYTSRMNKYTTIDKDQAVELKDFFSVEYERSLKETIDALEISGEESCIECDPLIEMREVLP